MTTNPPKTTHNLPCPCGESSRSFSTYSDGGAFCHRCRRTYDLLSKEELPKVALPKDTFNNLYNLNNLPKDTKEGKEGLTLLDLKSKVDSIQVLPRRGYSERTALKYNISSAVDANGVPIFAIFKHKNGSAKFKTPDKKIWCEGPIRDAGLFGQDLFPAGSAKAITITEGEDDAAAAYEMLGDYPVVSLTFGAAGAKADCIKAHEYLDAFDKIYLCFDMDEPGQKAVKEVSQLFNVNKIYHVQIPAKDANDMLLAGKTAEFKKSWWAAKKFVPEGIYSSFDEFDKIIDESAFREGVPLPWPTWQDMTCGLMTGEVYLLTAMEGVGKSEVVRQLEYHLFRNTDSPIGIIHLEENRGDILKRYASTELGRPVHLPDSVVSNEEIKEAIRRIFVREGRAHIYSHYGSDDPDVILGIIRFMVAALGCKYVFLDHITMVVSGLRDDDERKALDYISTQLGHMVKELDFCLVMVSHVTDEGKTRGSRLISKAASTWIELDRDVRNENEYLRSIIHATFNKNRPTGRTGPGGKLIFNAETASMYEPRRDELPHE